MSVLDDFVRMRLYRKRAAELDIAAADVLIAPDVRKRYRVAADHYRLLAEAEERSEKAKALSRLSNWKTVSRPQSALAQQIAQTFAMASSPLFEADLMEEVIRYLLKMAGHARRKAILQRAEKEAPIGMVTTANSEVVPLCLSPQGERATPITAARHRPSARRAYAGHNRRW